MKRLLTSLRYDVVRQIRYGLYGVSVAMMVVWGVVLGFFADAATEAARAAVPAFLAVNPIITTFYFMAALVLFEKTEDTLTAIVTTPLRDSEYLLAKGVSLTVLALVENLFIVVLLFGMQFNWGWLTAGAAALSMLYCWAGFVTIVRYDSVNSFLLPSAMVVAFSVLPLGSHFGLVSREAFLWHPIEPALTVMRAAYQPVSLLELLFGIFGMTGWALVSYAWARRLFRRFVVQSVSV